MTPLWLEDIEVGSRFRTQEYRLTREDIAAFARRFDPQPFHLGDEAARQTFFGGMAASGWHTAAISMRLLVTSGIPIATGIIGASVDLSWPTPTRLGDTLHVELEVIDVKRSRSRPERGFVTTVYDTLTEQGAVRQHTNATLLAFARPVSSDPR